MRRTKDYPYFENSDPLAQSNWGDYVGGAILAVMLVIGWGTAIYALVSTLS